MASRNSSTRSHCCSSSPALVAEWSSICGKIFGRLPWRLFGFFCVCDKAVSRLMHLICHMTHDVCPRLLPFLSASIPTSRVHQSMKCLNIVLWSSNKRCENSEGVFVMLRGLDVSNLFLCTARVLESKQHPHVHGSWNPCEAAKKTSSTAKIGHQNGPPDPALGPQNQDCRLKQDH